MPSTDTKSERESSLLNLKDELLTLASLRRVDTKDSMDSTSEQWIAHAKSSSKNESMAYSKGKMHGGHKILEFADGLWLGQGEQQQTMTIIKDHLHPMMIDEDVEFLGDDGSSLIACLVNYPILLIDCESKTRECPKTTSLQKFLLRIDLSVVF